MPGGSSVSTNAFNFVYDAASDSFVPQGPMATELAQRLQLARGSIPGAQSINIRGRNGDIDTGTLPETVWNVGGVYPFPGAPVNIEVVSTSALDTAAGVGAQTVLVTGLNNAGAILTNAVALNGVTPVPIIQQYFRVNDFTTVTVGATGINQGTIDVRVAGGGAVLGRIEPAAGNLSQCVYTVPADRTGFLMWVTFGMPSAVAQTCEFNLRSRFGPTAPWLIRYFRGLSGQGTTAFHEEFYYPRLFGPNTDIEIQVPLVSASNIVASAYMQLTLLENNALLRALQAQSQPV